MGCGLRAEVRPRQSRRPHRMRPVRSYARYPRNLQFQRHAAGDGMLLQPSASALIRVLRFVVILLIRPT